VSATLFLVSLLSATVNAEGSDDLARALDTSEGGHGLDLGLEDDDWNYALRFNGWLPSLTGTVGVSGIKTEVDLPISSILDHLNMSFQTSFAARKGRWGFAADLFYVKISGGTAKEKTTMISSLGLDIKEAFGQGTVFYRTMDWDGGRSFLDVGAGARLFGLDMELDIARDDAGVDAFSSGFASGVVDEVFQATEQQLHQGLAGLSGEASDALGNAIREEILGDFGQRLADRFALDARVNDAIQRLIDAAIEERLASGDPERAAQARRKREQAQDNLANRVATDITENWEDEASGSKSWVDPVLAVRMRHWLNQRVFLNLYGDVGGFGVGSRLTWAAAGGFGYQAKENLSLELYYRAYSVDYENDGFIYDTNLHGVFAGFAYHF
jgi:hypothetical protein